jgi:hypothetical protein
MDVEAVLNRYSSVPFVRRILTPFKAPVAIDDADPEKKRVMTHKMAWGEADGKYYVFPTVMPDESGALRNFGDKAMDEAFKRRDVVPFNTPEEAAYFSENYKKFWDKIGYKPQVDVK